MLLLLQFAENATLVGDDGGLVGSLLRCMNYNTERNGTR
jgi:hypothetical protein